MKTEYVIINKKFDVNCNDCKDDIIENYLEDVAFMGWRLIQMDVDGDSYKFILERRRHWWEI